MAKTTLLYTVTDDTGKLIVKDAEAPVAAKAIGTSRNYLQQCANGGIKCHKKYQVTVKEKALLKGKNTGYENFTMELANDWDSTMYGIRKRLRLDMSHWDEFMARRAN